MRTKHEIIENELQGYLRASREEKKYILDRLEKTIRMHRKAIIRRFRMLQTRKEGYDWCDTRGRSVYYTPDVTAALHEVWEISNGLCGERLHPVMHEYVTILIRDHLWNHTDVATGKLFAMSLGTMKDRIEKFERIKTSGGRCLTKPSELKELIPVRRGPWENPLPGFKEVDTVAHCGGTLAGEFAYTVQNTDVATTWCQFEGQMGKGKYETKRSMESMRKRSPFPDLGYDPDTGSEFINWHIKDWCDREKIVLTRIRPGQKNDHGRIEQKNYANVRQYVGYIRIDTEEKVIVLNELYRVFEVYVNHFLPSMKCVGKRKGGVRYRREYDIPKTPYQRVMEHPSVGQKVKETLQTFHSTLNPKVLHDQITKIRAKLFKNAKM